MADSGLPHAVCVELARRAVAEGPASYERSAALARANVFARSLLGPVINATGVLLHTNLGRAPLEIVHAAHCHQHRVRSPDRRARFATTGGRHAVGHAVRRRGGDGRQQQRGSRAARARRSRPRSPGRRQPRRERRDRRRLSHPRRDGAVGRAPGRCRHHQPHPSRRLPQGDRPQERRRRRRPQGAPEQLPRRGVRRGRRRSPNWRRSAFP